MSKGLEALRRICLHLVAHDETQHKEFDEYVSVIEKELKTLEIIRKNKMIRLEEWEGFSKEKYDLLKEVLL